MWDYKSSGMMIWYGMVWYLKPSATKKNRSVSLVWLRKKKNSETKKGLVWTRPYNYKAFRTVKEQEKESRKLLS